MATGPNQILIKRSDTAGVEPSGLSFGEPAINTADGRLFFSKQTEGTASGDFWEFKGFTDDGFVTSVNGVTGDVTVTDLVGGATDIIGISNGVGFAGVTAVAFGAVNDGVTFSAVLSGQTASITIDLAGFEPSTVFRRQYTYTELTGVLNTPNATANGELEYNQDTKVMSIFKFDKDGKDFRKQLAPVPDSGVSGRVLLTFGDGAQPKAYEFDSASSTTNYDATNLDLFIDNISDGLTGGSGKVVSVEIELDNARQSARSMRLPGNGGTTFDTVVTSFNGLTGDVTTNGLVLPVAGISSNGGATFASDVIITSDSGDIALTIKADTDNSTENDNPIIRLEEDGGLSSTDIGLAGSDDHPFTGALSNAFYIRPTNDTQSFQRMQFATGNVARVTLDSTGKFGINTKHPTEKLDVDGVIRAQQGISADGGVTLGGTLRVDGNVNVGTTLDVDGNIDVSGDIISHDDFNIQRPSGELILSALGSSTIINNSGANQDVIIKGNGDSSLFYSDAGNNKIGIGTNVPAEKLHVVGTIAASTGITLGGGITFADGTHQSTAASGGGGGATLSIGFIIDGNGSPITTGHKLDALKQVPFDCQVLNTSAFIPDGASGPTKTIVFGVKKTAALSSSITGTTLEIGNTGSADQVGFTFDGVNGGVFFRELGNVSDADGSTIGANEWIFPQITGNSGDINKLQIFMTVSPT